jgi:hypothetical protein
LSVFPKKKDESYLIIYNSLNTLLSVSSLICIRSCTSLPLSSSNKKEKHTLIPGLPLLCTPASFSLFLSSFFLPFHFYEEKEMRKREERSRRKREKFESRLPRRRFFLRSPFFFPKRKQQQRPMYLCNRRAFLALFNLSFLTLYFGTVSGCICIHSATHTTPPNSVLLSLATYLDY